MAEVGNILVMNEESMKAAFEGLKDALSSIGYGSSGNGSAGGINTVETVENVPVDKNITIAEISDSESFSLAETLAAGKEVHVVVKNTSGSGIVVTLPNDGGYICLVDSALSIESESYAEINVISDGENMYIRAV